MGNSAHCSAACSYGGHELLNNWSTAWMHPPHKTATLQLCTNLLKAAKDIGRRLTGPFACASYAPALPYGFSQPR